MPPAAKRKKFQIPDKMTAKKSFQKYILLNCQADKQAHAWNVRELALS
jgi:hypothetical protein